MTPGAVSTVLALLGWGTIAGLDLVSVPQALLSRPLVIGAGAGLLVGDVPTGLHVGLLLELFALDVLPVGASRYPDYGAATVGAVVLASSLGPWRYSLGVAAFYALVLAALGGWSLQRHRESAGRALRAGAAGLAAGDAATIARLQWRGIGTDALRSCLLTALALLGAEAIALRLDAEGPRFALVSAAAVGAGIAAALSGAIRSAGRGRRLRWLAAGVGVGAMVTILR